MVEGERQPSVSVFLCYARRQPDEDWAKDVIRILRQRYNVRVWFDKRYIGTGRDYDEEIKGLIRSADALVFLGSSSSVTSSSCQEECIYARDHGKPILPLFIDDTSWGDFPEDFRRRQYEQLHRATDDEQLATVIGESLLSAGLNIDRALVPERTTDFDTWADHVHPPYGKIRRADAGKLRKYVDECSLKLKLSLKHGYHNLNLALLFLRLGEQQRAAEYAEIALRDLPGRPDAHYYEALIMAAAEPLATMRRSHVARIDQHLETAIQLGVETAPKIYPAGSAMPWLLKAVIAHDYYLHNGLISTVGDTQELLNKARRGACDAQEIDRLQDSLSFRGLSPWAVQAISTFRSNTG